MLIIVRNVSIDPVDGLPSLPVKKLLPLNTESEETLRCALQWWEFCGSAHGHCPPQLSIESVLPDRVIDVSHEIGPEYVRLVESNGEKHAYVCLSYCWGKINTEYVTTKENRPFRNNKIILADLPKTIRDAVNFTRRLKQKFLWVDAICIVQNDEEDWRMQGQQMASIYRNSSLTIAAAGAASANEGLFFETASKLRNESPLDLQEFGISFPVYTRVKSTYEAGHLFSERNPDLLTRGWVFQERLISPRVLYFGKNEIAWECRAAHACECEPRLVNYPPTTNLDSDTLKKNPKAVFSQFTVNTSGTSVLFPSSLWHKMVDVYTSLNLTFNKDRFPALSGLATEVQRSRPEDEYIAGLWKSTFMADLLWRRHRKPSDTGPRKSETEYIAPSWSWASAGKAIEHDELDIGAPEFATLLIADCQTHPDNPKGQVTSGWVTIQSKIVEVTCRAASAGYKLYSADHVLMFSDADYSLFDNIPGRYCIKDGSKLCCCLIAHGPIYLRPRVIKNMGLVLYAIDDAFETFVRVGIFEETFIKGQEWSLFGDVTEQTVITIF